jgi:hypothetical protein
MKKQITILVLLCLQQFSARQAEAQVIPNAGFENWTTDIWSNYNPDQWETSNGDFQASKIIRTMGYQGNWALTTLNYTSSPAPCYARCKFAVPGHPALINGYFKTDFSATDTVEVRAVVYFNGSPYG